MESFTFIQWMLNNLDYWNIMILMTIESSFIPFPSEIIVPPAGYMAAAGELDVYLVMLFSTLGALLGAIINYFLAVWFGRPIVYWFADTRLGHILLLNGNKILKAENYFAKYGPASTFIGRLVPVIRQFISIPAGLCRMNILKFLLYTFLGAGIWNVFLTWLGYYLHSFVPRDELMTKVMEYSRPIGYAFLAVAALCVGYLVYKGMKKTNKQKNK
ncbi:MAG: DedA family protein [Bacteroidales bacterium]|jgi:membrane protein DedA with SNARE-associated domain|nr:DedA family protein [Bacteroidales bacterium]